VYIVRHVHVLSKRIRSVVSATSLGEKKNVVSVFGWRT